MQKLALNALKARNMLIEAGGIPEGSWKILLKRLRNSQGNLHEGKALADAKIKAGKLPNNILQKIISKQRKQRLGVEVSHIKQKDGISDTHSAWDDFKKHMLPTDIKENSNSNNWQGFVEPKYESSVSTDVHTHPTYNKIKKQQIISKPNDPDYYYDADFIKDLNLLKRVPARPSGINFNYNLKKATKELELKLKENTLDPEFRFNSNLPYSLSLQKLQYTRELEKKHKDYKKLQEHGAKIAIKKDLKIVDKLFPNIADSATPFLPNSDTALMVTPSFKNSNHVIIANQVQGIHKIKPKTEYGIRSFYFSEPNINI